MKKNSTAENNEKVTCSYEVKVTRAKEVKEGRVLFDANVNGVNISGLAYVEYKNSKGEENTLISFPAQKGKNKDENGKDIYYNTVWFPISKELKANIIEQLEKLV